MLSPVQNNGKLDFRLAASSGMGLLVAGNDTSGIGVSALLATLSIFPEVADKIRQEQQEVRFRVGRSSAKACPAQRGPSGPL